MQILYENINIPNELKSYIQDNISLHPYFDINFSGVKPKNYCGFISINNKSYFIAPKITTSKNQNLNIFIYMLIYSYDINIKNIDLSSSNSQHHNLLELFIKIFADTLFEELKRGVFKSYITLQENLKVLRGRYIIKENFSNFYHQNIYCEFDEFSMDNSLNHFLLYAISYLKKFSSYTNLYRCEMIPNANLIEDSKARDIFINLNDFISKTLGDDYLIGHSYFMSGSELDFVLEYKIIPLLEEYYYGDIKQLDEALAIINKLNHLSI